MEVDLVGAGSLDQHQSMQWKRHPGTLSWSNSQDMALLFEDNTIFSVNLGCLEKYSETIRSIFGLPSNISNKGTEESPVHIPEITVKEFDAFLKWFDDLSWQSGSKFDVDNLLDCQQQIIDDGKTWAVEQLNLLQPPLASSCRLYLAQTFHISEFVVPAVQELMTRSKDGKHIRAIMEEEVEEMGLIAFSTIARGLEGIDVKRTLMALTPPTLPQDNICKTHVKCKESWKKGWSTIIASKLVGKDSMVLSQIADSLTGMFFPSSLNFACKSKGVTKLRQGDIFQVEQVFIEKVEMMRIEEGGDDKRRIEDECLEDGDNKKDEELDDIDISI
ncbi:hypothetical protein BJ912DRAFT_922534 [Pholiota molesta]|nr:hypothetical protein BJ912DRAFT_922534 [Pholiota molesta]